MTQDRRITDRLPGHPLQWDDSASPSAAPAAGQAGLTKLNVAWYVKEVHEGWPEFNKIDEFSNGHTGGEALVKLSDVEALLATLAAPVAADTEQATDELSDEEQAALDRLDKPEWRAASHLKLRAVLAVEVARTIRMGAKIENLQDELRVTEGYRRGYADGTTDAAGMADVQNDWRGIWDESPVQGEGVLATDGATVIAARWFATGWAKHDHFSDELEYLPEGWVTHWKPFPPAQDANAQGGK